MIITKALAQKVLDTVDAGLVSGLGKPVPGQMCVEAAVCYALGEKHGDEPSCVAPAVRAIKIALNDTCWSSNAARTKGLRKVAIAQLGSKGVIDAQVFAIYVTEQTIRRIVPLALYAAAKAVPSHKEALEKAAKVCEVDGDEAAAREAAAEDESLFAMSIIILEALQKTKSPGCEWLDLVA